MSSVEPVAAGVFAVEQSVVEGKNGLVVGRRAALAIDTGDGDADGRRLIDLIERLGHRPVRLLLSHGHGDHVLGGAGFRRAGADVFASERCPAVMRRHLPSLAARLGRPSADLEAELAWPNVTFSDRLRLDLGGKRVELFTAPGHSEDGVAAYVVEDGVLFGADTAVTGIVPAIGDGDSARLVASLRQLVAIEAAVLVPGHGPVVRGRAEVRAALAWSIEYLEGLRAFLRSRLDGGLAPTDAVGAADYARFVGDRFPPERHGMLRRHRDTATKIVQELSGP